MITFMEKKLKQIVYKFSKFGSDLILLDCKKVSINVLKIHILPYLSKKKTECQVIACKRISKTISATVSQASLLPGSRALRHIRRHTQVGFVTQSFKANF